MTPARLLGGLATILGLGLAPPGEALPRSSLAPTVVAIQYDSDAASLVRVDPVSLQRIDDMAVPLDHGAGGWKLSPDGTKAAFGSNQGAALRIYDLAQMKLQSSVEVGTRSGSVSVIAWPTSDRLVALVQLCCATGATVVSVDPENGSVLARVPLKGAVPDSAPTRDGAVVLVARANTIGPSRLAVVNADGSVRWVTVARVRVGIRPKPSLTNGQLVEPGLAVDTDGARVFLVQANGPAAEIHLPDLTVGYHAMRRGGRRLAAAQKEFRGPWRVAQYLGDGLIAVSGYNGVRKGAKFAFVAAGLTVVDSRDWTERTLDRTTTWFTFTSPLLLVIHIPDVVAYSPGGQVRFRLTTGQPLGIATALGHYAYVWLANNRIAVVDVAAGTLVNETPPTLLMPIALAPS